MKKIFIAIITIILFSNLSIIGYGGYKGTVQKRVENYDSEKGYNLVKDTKQFMKDKATKEKELDEKGIIPIYEEKSLLRDTLGNFYMGRDAGFYNFLPNTRTDLVGSILTAYPSKAVRETDYGYYIMYDTDSGIRLYLFFRQEEHNDFKYLSGFPIIMKKTLSYKHFADIEIGDSIDKVEDIDPVITQYKTSFDRAKDIALENYTKMGAGPTSIHLLSDGILKIEYKREGKSYVITNLTYSPNFELDCSSGKLSYAINASDYMKN